jgi:hypothetical protein
LPGGAGYAGRAMRIIFAFGGSVFVGVFAFPAVLPFLPFKAFSLKGACLGLAWGVVASFALGAGFLGSAAAFLISIPIISFIAMNYTGSSTYTCQEGARLEVVRGTIPMAVSLLAGLGLFIFDKLA